MATLSQPNNNKEKRQQLSKDDAIYNSVNASFKDKIAHQGMPTFDPSGPAISWFEFLPPKLFYIPVFLYCLYLSIRYRGATLPCNANPHFPMGGFVGESKELIFDEIQGENLPFTLNYAGITRQACAAEEQMDACKALLQERDIAYPFICKPDMGCRGVGVQIVRDDAQLLQYISNFPVDTRILMQELIPYEGEAGVFYVQQPGKEHGEIFSLTLKYFPYVYGDGVKTLKELILEERRASQISHVYMERHKKKLDDVVPKGQAFRLAFTGSHSRGTIFRNGNQYITDAMRQSFQNIAQHIPNFHFGRFDVRFEDFNDLQQGENFKIVEINGGGGEATHIWDRNTKIMDAYTTLFKQYHMLYHFGFLNKKMGFKPPSLKELIVAWQDEKQATQHYPYTE